MEGSASVRKSLSGTLVPSSTTTVAVLEKTGDQNNEKQNKKVLDDDEYVEVSTDEATGDDRNVMFTTDKFALVAFVNLCYHFSFKTWQTLIEYDVWCMCLTII